VPYGNPLWTTDATAAHEEAERRIRRLADAAQSATPLRLHLHDLHALVRLPASLADVAGLEEVLIYTDERGRRKLRGGHALRDCGALLGLKQLRVVELWETRVADLSPLQTAKALRELTVCGAPVADIRPLAGLTSLELLNLSNTQVADLDALRGLGRLLELYLSRTRVSDLTPIAGTTSLETLFVNRTQVTQLDALVGLTGLVTLNLHHTRVSDLSPLAAMEMLEDLDLSGTDVSSLAAIEHLSIERVDTSGTALSRA